MDDMLKELTAWVATARAQLKESEALIAKVNQTHADWEALRVIETRKRSELPNPNINA